MQANNHKQPPSYSVLLGTHKMQDVHHVHPRRQIHHLENGSRRPSGPHQSIRFKRLHQKDLKEPPKGSKACIVWGENQWLGYPSIVGPDPFFHACLQGEYRMIGTLFLPEPISQRVLQLCVSYLLANPTRTSTLGYVHALRQADR